MKKLLAVLLLLGVAWWFFLRGAPAPAAGVRIDRDPEQTETQEPAFPYKNYEIQPLAGYRISARVLSRKRYRTDPASEISPIDLALGWKAMSDSGVLSHLSISQSGRWYEYTYGADCPLPAGDIVLQSANVHCIPANDLVWETLKGLRKNSFVELEGWLVEVRHEGRPPWRSSLERNDYGGGACEVFWITSAREFKP